MLVPSSFVTRQSAEEPLQRLGHGQGRATEEFGRSSGSRGVSRGSAAPPQWSMPLGNLPYVNIPGYTGFVPGKAVENVIGATHSRTNALSLVACSRRGEPDEQDHFARRSNAYGLLAKRRGADVPGYTGYIPAKHAANVFGTTFCDSNSTAMEVRREMALNRSHRPPPVMNTAPMAWTGLHGAYVAAAERA
ncbi:unnamed protein product [Polarella glacialis]|uniref:Uncharacterized protein n=1 Tax=Polarella glacialis TaxID=89957 RepID=A0A813ECZ0_POLGL|nr:unnamed protein product [Polarella glacialis]CAE8712860.1 unnamed protein product [Polarella glacialis]